jgi:hypothetical protein
MLKSSPKPLLTAVLVVSLAVMGACTAPERKVELQGSTPTLPTPRIGVNASRLDDATLEEMRRAIVQRQNLKHQSGSRSSAR